MYANPPETSSFSQRCVGNLLQYIKSERDKFYEEPSNEEKEVTIFSSYRKTEKPTHNVNARSYKSFYCDICSVDCTSQSGYDSHLKGKKHMKNMKKIDEQSVLSWKKADKLIYREACIQKVLDEMAISESLVGVGYLTEYISPEISDQQRYSCDLCQARGSKEMIISHIVGRQHRKTFMKAHHNEKYQEMIIYPSTYKNLKASQISARLRKMSEDVLAHSKNKIGQVKVAEKPDENDESSQIDLSVNAVKEVKKNLEKKEVDLMKKELELVRREAELEKVRRNMMSDVRNSKAASRTRCEASEYDSAEYIPPDLQTSHRKRKLGQGLNVKEYRNMDSAKKHHMKDYDSLHNTYDNTLATEDNGDDSATNHQSVLLRNALTRKGRPDNADTCMQDASSKFDRISTASNRNYSSMVPSSSKQNFIHKLEEQEFRIKSALDKLQKSIGQSRMTPEETIAKEKLTKILVSVKEQKRRAILGGTQIKNMPSSRFELQHLGNDRDSSKKYFASTEKLSRACINHHGMQTESTSGRNYNASKSPLGMSPSQAEPATSQTAIDVRNLIEETRQKVEKKILLELDKGSLAGLAKVFENDTDLQAALRKWEHHGKGKKESDSSSSSLTSSGGVSVQVHSNNDNRHNIRTVRLSPMPGHDDDPHTDRRYYDDVSSLSLRNTYNSNSPVLKQFPRATANWKQAQKQYPIDDDEAAGQLEMGSRSSFHGGRQGRGLLGDRPGLLGTRPESVTHNRRDFHS